MDEEIKRIQKKDLTLHENAKLKYENSELKEEVENLKLELELVKAEANYYRRKSLKATK